MSPEKSSGQSGLTCEGYPGEVATETRLKGAQGSSMAIFTVELLRMLETPEVAEASPPGPAVTYGQPILWLDSGKHWHSEVTFRCRSFFISYGPGCGSELG